MSSTQFSALFTQNHGRPVHEFVPSVLQYALSTFRADTTLRRHLPVHIQQLVFDDTRDRYGRADALYFHIEESDDQNLRSAFLRVIASQPSLSYILSNLGTQVAGLPARMVS